MRYFSEDIVIERKDAMITFVLLTIIIFSSQYLFKDMTLYKISFVNSILLSALIYLLYHMIKWW